MSTFFESREKSLQKSITDHVRDSAGGRCQCEFEWHGHQIPHDKRFDECKGEPSFVLVDPSRPMSYDNVIFVCPFCYRKIQAARRRIR